MARVRAPVAQAWETMVPVASSAPINAANQGPPYSECFCGTVIPRTSASRLLAGMSRSASALRAACAAKGTALIVERLPCHLQNGVLQ